MKTEMMKSQVVEKIAFWLRALSGSGSNFTVTRMNQKKTLLKGFFTRRLTWQRLQNNRKKRAVDVFKSIIRALDSSLELTVVKQNQLCPRCERTFVTQSLSIVVQFARLLDVFWCWLNLFKA